MAQKIAVDQRWPPKVPTSKLIKDGHQSFEFSNVCFNLTINICNDVLQVLDLLQQNKFGHVKVSMGRDMVDCNYLNN